MHISTTYSISDLAREFGITLRCMRFWETRGLLAPARDGTQRVYYEADRIRLRKILAYSRQGFTLSEIRGALDTGGFPKAKVVDQIDHLRRQRADIDKAIADLCQQVAA